MKTVDSILLSAVTAAALSAMTIPMSMAQTSITGDAPSTASATPNGTNPTRGSAAGASANDASNTGDATATTVAVNTATATVDGREIIASARTANVRTESNFARVQLDDHVLTVERDRLLVDGSERAKLPASAKNVRLSLSGERLNVVADGREVLSEKLSKE